MNDAEWFLKGADRQREVVGDTDWRVKPNTGMGRAMVGVIYALIGIGRAIQELKK